MNCPHCDGAEKLFDIRKAERDLEAYRTHGPAKTTHLLTQALKDAGVEHLTLLDIGGGVGAIQHELFKDGLGSAIAIDASSSYLQTARQEAERMGYAARITYHHGDFVAFAPQLPVTDIVTLEKVICCYPDVQMLVGLSSARAGKFYGVVFPRDSWWMKIVGQFINLSLWLQRNPFRFFVHPTEAIEMVLRANGFERRYYHQTLLWQIIVYAR
jgi:2-polyprenyl-3-methyl-5-hydroxy-6-metoxy-1,4-benzoquinol methylase